MSQCKAATSRGFPCRFIADPHTGFCGIHQRGKLTAAEREVVRCARAWADKKDHAFTEVPHAEDNLWAAVRALTALEGPADA